MRGGRLAEQVFVARAQQRARAGAVVGGEDAARGRRSGRPARRSPLRARGRRPRLRRRRRASQVALQLAPVASRGARASRRARAMPARPIATSSWPWRHARPKLSADQHGGGPSPVSSARAVRRAADRPRRRRRGRAAAGRRRPRRRAFEHVDAGVRADEAVAGAADQHAALVAQHLHGLVEDHLDEPRVAAAGARAISRARSPGLTPASSRTRALGLGDGRVRDRDERRRSSARRRASAISCARSSPAPISGCPEGTRERLRSGSAISRGGDAERRCRVRARARVGGDRAGRPDEPRAQLRRGPRRCRCRASARVARSIRQLRPAARGERAWRSQLPGPKLGRDRVGRREQEAVRAGAVAVGDDHDLAGMRRERAERACEQRVELGAGRAPGSRRGRRGRAARPRRRARDAEAARVRLARLAAAVVDEQRPRRARGDRRDSGSPLTTIVSATARHCGRAPR